MKTVRFIAVVLALALFVTAFIPAAQKPVAAQALTYPVGAPAQAFMQAVMGLPLLAPMSIGAFPVLTLSVEKAATKDYACTLLAQSPKDWVTMQRRQDFDAVWTLQNTGIKNWGKTGVDFGYVSGAKMHTKASRFDIANDVGSYQKIKLSVDMNAPKTKGYYTAVWGLYNSAGAFCRVTISINVNR